MRDGFAPALISMKRDEFAAGVWRRESGQAKVAHGLDKG